MVCPDCNSDNIVKKGTRAGKQRYRCNDCGLWWSDDATVTETQSQIVEDDKKTGGFDWREWSSLLMQRQALHEKASWSQDSANVKIETEYPCIVWKPMADMHIGDMGADYESLVDFTDKVMTIPYLYLSLSGDEEDNFISFKNQLAILQQILNPEEQDSFLESWLSEIAPRILFSGYGNHCLTPDYDVLTKRGWLKYNELTKNDMVLSFDPKTEACRWDTINQVITNTINDEIVIFKTRGFEFSGTKNHRMLGQTAWDHANDKYRYVLSDDLERDIFYIKSSANIDSDEYSINDDLLYLIGWILTDGQIANNRGKNDYRIYQSKDTTKIISVLNRLGYKYSDHCRDRDTKSICGKLLVKRPMPQHCIRVSRESDSILNEVLPTKQIQDWMYNLSNRQFNILLEAIIDGDGTRRGINSSMIYGEYAFLSSLQGLCVMHGYRSKISQNNRGDNVLYITKKQTTIIQPSIHKTYELYSGITWCLNVPLSNFMVRKNGTAYFTGNSEFEERVSARNTVKKILSRNVVYFNGIGVCNIKVNDQTYKAVSTHKCRYNSSFNKTHGLKQLARRDIPDADVYISAHIHDPAYEISFERGIEQAFIVLGSIKRNDGYAKRYFADFSARRDAAIVLDSTEHRMIVFPCLEDALDYAKLKNGV